MSEQIKMTEEEFDKITEFIYEIIYSGCGKFIESETRQYVKNCCKSAGYIFKSDLEILVEECETNFKNKEDTTDLEDDLYRCIQAMKAELNKRREG